MIEKTRKIPQKYLEKITKNKKDVENKNAKRDNIRQNVCQKEFICDEQQNQHTKSKIYKKVSKKGIGKKRGCCYTRDSQRGRSMELS